MDGIWLYTIDPEASEPIMLIDGHIGFDEVEGFGVMGDMFQKELLLLDTMGKLRIQVWINSPGGCVADGYSIYNAILRSKTKVDTYCTGMAASIAGVIFQAGRTRIMSDYAWLMYHNPFSNEATATNALTTITESLARMVAERSGKNIIDVKNMMQKESYIMAEEALSVGLTDKVEYSSDQNKKRLAPLSADVKAFLKEASIITNSILNAQHTPTTQGGADTEFIDMMIPHHQKAIAIVDKYDGLVQNEELQQIMENIKTEQTEEISQMLQIKDNQINNKLKIYNQLNMKQIANKLNLNPEASEPSIVEAIESVQNQVQHQYLDIQNKDAEISRLLNEIASKENELLELKNKMAVIESESKAKAEAEIALSATQLIEAYVNEGRIKNDPAIISGWMEKAKNDFSGIRALLETLPLNRAAVKLSQTTQTQSESPKYSFAGQMIHIANKKS